jgi:hypothetical protein
MEVSDRMLNLLKARAERLPGSVGLNHPPDAIAG